MITSESVLNHAHQIKNNITGTLADKKRVIATIIPPVLIAVMYPVFHSLTAVMASDRLAWYFGLSIYWLIWGAVFPLIIIGRNNIKALIRPQKPSGKVILPVSIIWGGALASRLFVPGMGYENETVWILLLLLSTTLGNGFFEEVLWRGVYFKIFPDRLFFRMIYPSLWFGVWHFVPGSVFHDDITGLIGLMAGSMMMGLVLSYLTGKTHTLWWSMLAHCIGGIIMVT